MTRRTSWLIWGLCGVWTVGSSLAAFGQIENRKLTSLTGVSGVVSQPALSPDGSRVVYIANPAGPTRFELFSVAVGGGTPIRLSPPLTPGGIVSEFEISADGTQVLFLANGDDLDLFELYGVSTLGGTAVKLNGPMHGSAEIREYGFSSDSSRAIFIADQEAPNTLNLYSVPVGGGVVTQLNTPTPGVTVESFRVSPDSSRVIFVTDETGNEELFSVPVAGGQVVQLNDPVAPGRRVGSYSVLPDSSAVLFTSELTSGDADLFSVPLEGGATRLLYSEEGADARGPILPTADGTMVVFRSAQGVSITIHRLTLDTLDLLELASPLRFLFSLQITPDQSRLLYAGRNNFTNARNELHIVSLADGTSIQLNPDFNSTSQNFEDVRISDDSQRVVYLANGDSTNFDELFAVPASGGQVRKLNPSFTEGDGITGFRFSSDGQSVIYRGDQDTEEIAELYTVPWAGGSPVQLNQPLPHDGEVGEFVVGAGRVFFTAETSLTVRELDEVAEGGGVVTPLSDPPLGVSGSAGTPFLSFDESRVVFTATQSGTTDLFSLPLDGSAPAVRLNDPLPPGGRIALLRLGAADDRVVFATQDGFNQCRCKLYSTVLDGTGGTVQLNSLEDGEVRSASLSGDGLWVAFTTRGLEFGDPDQLFTVPAAGGVVQQINTSGDDVDSFAFSADDQRLVFETDAGLFSAPVRDGSPVLLSAETGAFAIRPDSTLVAFEDDDTNGLFTVPIDGGGVTELLASTGGRPQFGSDGERIFFRYTPGSLDNLFSIPTGGGAAVQLNDRSQHAQTLVRFAVSPDNGRVAMSLGTDTRPYMLATTPSAGGEMVVLEEVGINPPQDTGIRAFAFTPDSSQVVYEFNFADGRGDRLFRIPAAGGERVALNPTGNVQIFRLTDDGQRLFYTVIQPGATDRTALLTVPLAGGTPVRMHPPLLPDRDVGSFSPTADGLGVIYRADQDLDGVFDLYFSRLVGVFADGFESGDTSRWSTTQPTQR